MKPLLFYLLLINATSLLLMLSDKHKAKKDLWRISEKSLLLVAFLGGSLGTLLGMYLFHHKTKHLKFTLVVPVFLLAQSIILLLIFK